jgi:hypothetical protein
LVGDSSQCKLEEDRRRILQGIEQLDRGEEGPLDVAEIKRKAREIWTRLRSLPPAVALLAFMSHEAALAGSLRFHGNGVAAPELDRVVILLDEPHRPVDVGAADFTVEFWMKANPGENGSTADCNGNADDWIFGNILLDRDVFGAGDWGDWGISLANGRVIFGAYRMLGDFGAAVCGTTDLADGTWHHVAVTRRFSDGFMSLFVDGLLEDSTLLGPDGDVSYRDGRTPNFPWEPYLVIGAEKHDAGAEFPSCSGWVDELRLSTVLRYTAGFTPPDQPFTPDGDTAALYHFDEGMGNFVGDSSGAAGGPSDGERRFGGDPAGPEWSAETPFDDGAIFADGFESGDTSAWDPSP